jgi:TolB-like protein
MDIDPSGLEVVWSEGRVNIQPRAMQVLIVLARGAGAVVSRDTLVSTCWDGRPVSDNVINRVIYLLRTLAERAGGRAFTINTVAKVGYRLVAAEAVAAPPVEPLLAVLAFDNLTGDSDLRYFSDGLSEEIMHTVSKTTGLRVVGRSSSFSLRGGDKSTARVADLLGATHLLDGSVRRGGDQIRITAQLMACGGQTPLWSDRFDRSLADIFAVQDEIAAAVAAALNVAFAPSPATAFVEPAAYDLYLRALSSSIDGLIPDAALLEQTTVLAPRFARAWAVLAYSRALSLRWGFGRGPASEQRAAVEAAAQTALALDGAAGPAYLALATVEPVCGRFSEQRALVTKALAAEPNEPIVLLHACALCDVTGRQRQALGHVERAYELDPRFVGWYRAYMLEAVGRRREASTAYDRDLARWPEVEILHANALRSAYEAGDWERYDRLLSRLPEGMTDRPLLALVRFAADRERRWSGAEAAATLETLRQAVRDTGTVSLAQAGMLGGRGHVGEVYDVLDTASFAHLFTPEGSLPPADFGLNILFSPLFRALRRDARFARLCARLGLGHFWAANGEWPDCADEVAPFYDLEAETRRAL